MTDIITELEKFLREYHMDREALSDARRHILANLEAFPMKELECMATDGIIKHSDIPIGSRTTHSKFMAEKEEEGKEKEVPLECVWCERLSFFSVEDIKTLVRMYSGSEAIRKANVGHKFPSGDKVAEVPPSSEAEQANNQREE